mgnify:CR=1 FL=1|tara:strand:- start:66 stop:980 length:915 start_codon:yes stop_codon:yes gene_type:complete
MIDFVWNSLKKFVYSIYDWCIYLHNNFNQFVNDILYDYTSFIIELFELINYFGFNTRKISFDSNEVDTLVDYLRDIQQEFKCENTDNFIVTDSITFYKFKSQKELFSSLEINQNILKHQIQSNISDFFGIERALTKEVCKVLTPVLSGGHFYLLELDLSINKVKDTDLNFVINKATLVDSLSSTNAQVKNNIELLVNRLNNQVKVDYSLVNTKEQGDHHSCGPRVIKSIMGHLKLYDDDIIDKYPLLQTLKDLPKGANPYKEITSLLKQAYKAKETKKNNELVNPEEKIEEDVAIHNSKLRKSF